MEELKQKRIITNKHGTTYTQTICCGKLSGLYKHGNWHRNKPLERTWGAMIQRCYNPNRHNYKNYGGRGISVCDEWKTLSGFVDWALKSGWTKGLQIDRIDNDKGYFPENCRWVTPLENARNRRKTIILTINSEKQYIPDISKTTGISPFTIYYWIKKGGVEYAQQRIEQKIYTVS